MKNEEIIPCPKCNGSMILKNGKYGEFYGCSNFPTCTHAESVSDVQDYIDEDTYEESRFYQDLLGF